MRGLFCSNEGITLGTSAELTACGIPASAFIYVSAPQSNVFECANRGAHRGTS
jgi:hypothetical protein